MRWKLLLTLVVVIGVGCVEPSVASAAEGGPLRVATFRCDVTPPLGQPIYASYRPLAKVEHPLLAKGIVLADGPRRYVLCAVDWCELCNSTHLLFRRKIAEAAGTNVSCVAVQTVHQHTAPMADGDAYRLLQQVENAPPHPDPKIYDPIAVRLAASVKACLDRLEPFDHVGIGEARVERVASTRRIMTEDGKLRIRWSSCRDPALRAEPEGNIDPMLKTISFLRGSKPLARLHYYATHPQSFYRDPRASYDFPGIARERLEKQEDVPQVYFTGCAGDVTAGKYNDGSPQARAELAERLLAGMEASVASTRPVPVDRLQWRTVELSLPLRTDAGYTLADARAKMTDPKSGAETRIYSGAMAIAFAERIRQPIELSSLQIGNVFMLHLPGEPMIAFQHFARESMPDGFVAVAGYGDCGTGYICTAAAFEEGGYEPSASQVAPESEAMVNSAIRELLGVGPTPE